MTISVRNEQEWESFCEAVGSPELADDERFSSLQGRLVHQDELDKLVSEWTSSRDRYEVADLLQEKRNSSRSRYPTGLVDASAYTALIRP